MSLEAKGKRGNGREGEEEHKKNTAQSHLLLRTETVAI